MKICVIFIYLLHINNNSVSTVEYIASNGRVSSDKLFGKKK